MNYAREFTYESIETDNISIHEYLIIVLNLFLLIADFLDFLQITEF